MLPLCSWCGCMCLFHLSDSAVLAMCSKVLTKSWTFAFDSFGPFLDKTRVEVRATLWLWGLFPCRQDSVWKCLQSPWPEPRYWRWGSCVSIPVRHRQAERSSLTNGSGWRPCFVGNPWVVRWKAELILEVGLIWSFPALNELDAFHYLAAGVPPPVPFVPGPPPSHCQSPLQPTCRVTNLLPALANWLCVLQQDLIIHRARQDMTPNKCIALWLSHLCVTVGGSLLSVHF